MRTTTAQPNEAREAAERATRVTATQALIAATCTELRSHLGALPDLVDTRQQRLPFTTVEARHAMDELIRDERAARHAYTGRMATHAWLRPTTISAMSGQVPAPVSVIAVSLAAELHAYLADLANRLGLMLRAAGVCWIGERRLAWAYAESGLERVDTGDLLGHVERMVTIITAPDRLDRIHSTLEDLATRIRHLIDGDDKATLPEPCPWCGRHTLVVHFAEGTIVCEADPHTGRQETCLCSDSYCDCRIPGRRHRHTWHRHRHTWHRDRGAAPSLATTWYGLRDAQAFAARAHDDQEEDTTEEPS